MKFIKNYWPVGVVAAFLSVYAVAIAHGAQPHIVSRSPNHGVRLGGTATLSVEATSASPITYEWRFSDTNLNIATILPGATNATLILSNINFAQAGIYSVRVSNSSGLVSDGIVLNVFDLQMDNSVAKLRIGGPVGFYNLITNRVQFTTNLLNPTWTTLTNIVLPRSPIQVIDPGSQNSPQRYYRVWANSLVI